ncbi:ammonium transporter [Vigna unguiculata]|uniref:Ammonium transporter n=1 Tax=Vigna unguiculata TaxID=3917 RepID=A0A4D6NNR8_VIGUN|nr:ammonium transporter [Vigna unguiculata]
MDISSRGPFWGAFPNATMVYFQCVFAAITLILIAGAVLGRMNFYAWMLFVPLWLTFSYTFTAFSIWSTNGFLSKMGIIDYSGGYAIHLSSGVAGFTAAYWVGPRLNKDRERFPPNNILLMLAGAGLLWMGGQVNANASLAVLNTHACTATSLLTWVILDVIFFRKPSVIGVVQGMITGLVSITPAAGVVEGWATLLMRVFSRSIPWFTMISVVHKRSKLL